MDPDILYMEDLIRRADEALYDAKASGRNCVVFYTIPHSRIVGTTLTSRLKRNRRSTTKDGEDEQILSALHGLRIPFPPGRR
jgi:hypothetical protein